MYAKSLGIEFDELKTDRVSLSNLIDKAVQQKETAEFDRDQIRSKAYSDFLDDVHDDLIQNAPLDKLIEEVRSRNEAICLFRMSNEDLENCLDCLDDIKDGKNFETFPTRMRIYHADQIDTNTWLQVLYMQMALMSQRGDFVAPNIG